MDQVYLFVKIRVLPEKMDVFLERIRKHILLVMKEDGCISLEMYRDSEKDNLVYILEVWRDRPAWDAHMVIPHSIAWHGEAPQYVENESITVMSKL